MTKPRHPEKINKPINPIKKTSKVIKMTNAKESQEQKSPTF